ncbi:MAG: hypothetical protein ACK5T0_10610 [Vampirovibrionales bacterium]
MRLNSPPPPPASVQAQRQGANISELAQALNDLEKMMNATLQEAKQNNLPYLSSIESQKAACRKIKESFKKIPSHLEQRYNELINKKTIFSPPNLRQLEKFKPMSVFPKPKTSKSPK